MNGTEVAYAGRTATYIRNGLVGQGWTASNNCDECDIITDGDVYVDPATDDAPWYDPMVMASTEFFGIVPTRIDLLTTLSRQVANKVNGGGVVGPLSLKPRVLTFQGLMVASSQGGMVYGDRWLNEVLAGSACLDGCATDEATILPACPTDEYLDYDDANLYLRRLLDVGIVEGPTFQPVNDLPECYISGVSFQLAAGQPYLFSPGIPCAEDVAVSTDAEDPTCCLIETNSWPGDAVAVITLTADTAATNIHLEGKPTFDGQCPVADAMPAWELDIPVLEKGGVLTIDGARRQIRYRDPSLKIERSGIHLTSFEGPLLYPEVHPCSEFCICATADTGTVTMTVEKIIREL